VWLDLELFEDALKIEKFSRVYQAMDHLREQFGKHTVFLGSSYLSPSGISTKGRIAAEPHKYRVRAAAHAANPRQEHGSAAFHTQCPMMPASLWIEPVSP
jgi:hypothetical protein